MCAQIFILSQFQSVHPVSLGMHLSTGIYMQTVHPGKQVSLLILSSHTSEPEETPFFLLPDALPAVLYPDRILRRQEPKHQDFPACPHTAHEVLIPPHRTADNGNEIDSTDRTCAYTPFPAVHFRNKPDIVLP